ALVGEVAAVRVRHPAHAEVVDPLAGSVVLVADRHVAEDAVPLERAEVDVDRFVDPQGPVRLDRDVGGEALDRPAGVGTRGQAHGSRRQEHGDGDGEAGGAHVHGHSADAKMVARPRKVRNPVTSVTVVRTIDDDCAGSWRSPLRISGTAAPAMPASVIAISIARPITTASPSDRLQRTTPSVVVSATANPLRRPTPSSFVRMRGHCESRNSRRASPRIVTARACMPLFPVWPATTGMRTASAV